MCILLLLLPLNAASAQRVECTSSAGSFAIQLNHSLAPLGVERFISLVSTGFLDGQILHRVIPGFLVQFGIGADPRVHASWGHDPPLRDEPNRMPFRHGTLSFAGSGKDSRTTHMFVALAPSGERLGRLTPHETTLGHVIEGMDTWERVTANYKESGYMNTGGMTYVGYKDISRLQGALEASGNDAAEDFPKLDRIQSCTLDPTSSPVARASAGEADIRRLQSALSARGNDAAKDYSKLDGEREL